jgi:hypothetical protein
MKLSSATNLVRNRVCHVLSFLQSFQPITAAAMCTAVMNVLEPGAFNAESQYFIHPSLIKFHDFADNNQEGMKHQMGVQLRSWARQDWMPGENFQSGFMEVFMVYSHWLVLTENQTANRC